MPSIIEYLKNENIYFSLQYCGSNDLDTYLSIENILLNKDLFKNKLLNLDLCCVNSLSDYLDYLLVKKLSNMIETDKLLKKKKIKTLLKKYIYLQRSIMKK